MKRISNTRGFTLIELLVVIAIIGILSSVVLASLNTARAKGADAAVKSNLANMRAQAEIYYDDPALGNGTYGATATLCNAGMFATATFTSAIAAITTASAAPTCRAVLSPASWAISAPLKTSGHWCVDSSGASKATAAAITTTTC
jgi:prepilin-type N-terminal cleavage/methylation domain-containing protein